MWPICGQTRGGKGGLAGVFTQEGAPGRWAGGECRQAGIWHPSNHTRPRRLTASAARCMKSHRFTQRRWTTGDAAAIFNLRPPSRTECTVWVVVLTLVSLLSRSSSLPAEASFNSQFYSKMSYISPFKKKVSPSQNEIKFFKNQTKWILITLQNEFISIW